MSHFVKLQPSNGFPYKLIPPREDVWAREACETYFGSERVSLILEKYHRSTVSYDAMVDDLFEYGVTPAKSARFDPIYQLTLQTIRDDLAIDAPLIPLTMGAVPQRPDFPSNKSPGLPYKLEGFRTKGDVIDAGKLNEINRDWQDIGFRRKRVELPDVCLFARAQLTTAGNNKIRATWGYPISVYLEEGRFFYPVHDWIKSHLHKFPIAYGFEMANGGMVAIADMISRNPGSSYVCTDWSRFDKTIPPWLIRDAFTIIAGLIDWNRVKDVEGKVWEVRPEPSKRRWKRMVDYFVNTPIRTCKGERFLVSTGVPSGSCWTNLIDTVINAIVTRYCFYTTTGSFPVDEIYLGDDGVVVSNGIVNLDDMAVVAADVFGMVLNPKKSFVTTNSMNVHFLGYYNYAGYPFKPQDTLIASFIRPEHSRETAVEACSAALGQMWSGFDPGYAAIWYKIILYLADLGDIGLGEVAIHLRTYGYRHKYLMLIGLNPSSLTVPKPIDGRILQVLPSVVPTRLFKRRIYDLGSLWQACHRNFGVDPASID